MPQILQLASHVPLWVTVSVLLLYRKGPVRTLMDGLVDITLAVIRKKLCLPEAGQT
jgi:hypothetical protein